MMNKEIQVMKMTVMHNNHIDKMIDFVVHRNENQKVNFQHFEKNDHLLICTKKDRKFLMRFF